MTSTPTIRNRLLKMGTGDAVNTWGDQQSSGDFDMIDIALDGMLSLSISGSVVLSTANYVADQARNRLIKILSSSTVGATITLPGVEKWVLVWNASTFDQIFASQGGGSSVTVKSGELVPIMTDASNVARMTLLTMNGAQLRNVADPSSPQDACTKAYADALSFAAFSGSLPGQVGNAGKFLTTNGTTASWSALSAANFANFSAAAAAVRAGTTTSSALTPGDTYNAFAEVALTDAATISVDMSTFLNAGVTLGGNRTLGNPTNPKVGQSGFIRLIQDATGSRTLSFGGNWKRTGGAPTLSTTANAVDVLEYHVISPTYILYAVQLNPS